jgi:hypothetical protein
VSQEEAEIVFSEARLFVESIDGYLKKTKLAVPELVLCCWLPEEYAGAGFKVEHDRSGDRQNGRFLQICKGFCGSPCFVTS